MRGNIKMKAELLLNQLDSLIGISNFEYLVFKNKDGLASASTDFSKEEEESIYEVISTLPFPLNTNPLSADTIRRLMTNIPYNLHTDEKSAIQAVLKKIHKDLFILPFPKSLMQFYLALAVTRETHFFGHISEANSPALRNRQDHVHKAAHELLQSHINIELERSDWVKDQLSSDFEATINYVYCHSSSMRATEHTKANQKYNQLWFGLNKSLVQEIIDKDYTDLKSLYRELAQEFVIVYTQDKLVAFREIGKDKDSASKILDLFLLEIDIMFDPKYENKIALYRGTKNGYDGDIETYEMFKDNNSLSFGNGLCEGILKDTGACALKHLLYPSSGPHIKHDNLARGYVVFVNIPSFLDNKQEREFYWIPPLALIARVFGKGELFHARTLGSCGKGNSLIGGSLYDAIGKNYDPKNSVMAPAFRRAMELGRNKPVPNELLRHLGDNSMNLTPSDTGYNPTPTSRLAPTSIPYNNLVSPAATQPEPEYRSFLPNIIWAIKWLWNFVTYPFRAIYIFVTGIAATVHVESQENQTSDNTNRAENNVANPGANITPSSSPSWFSVAVWTPSWLSVRGNSTQNTEDGSVKIGSVANSGLVTPSTNTLLEKNNRF